MAYQTIHPHELGAYLHFTEYGLSPYWTLSALMFDEFDGYGEVRFEYNGREYDARFTYNPDTGIASRESDSISSDRLSEFKIHAESLFDEADADFNITPRFPEMRHPDGHKSSIPWPHDGEGVDIHTQGSNLWPNEYLPLLQDA